MEKIKVLTSQNVSIDYPLALAGERIISNLIDLALKGAYAIVISLVLSTIGIKDNVAYLILILLPMIFYTPMSEILMHGQTVGMRVRNTKVITLDGKPLTVGTILLRSLLRIVDISMSGGSIALISISVTKNGQRLGDIAAGTTVVKLSIDIKFSDIQFNIPAEDYQVRFEQVKQLNEEQIQIIKDTLAVFRKSKNFGLLDATARKVQNVLQVNTTMEPRRFLEVVVMDYNYLMGKV